MRFEEGGTVLVVTGPRMPRAGYVVSTRCEAHELIARAEVRRLGRGRWSVEQDGSTVYLRDRLSGATRIFRSPIGERTAWQQAAVFLAALKVAGRRAPRAV